MSPEERLRELGLVLPSPPTPVASYIPAQRMGNALFVSGQGPSVRGAPVYRGKVGVDLDEEEGYAAARLCALNALAVVKAELGCLSSVLRVVKLLGWVACSEDFDRQPFVINGASDLLGAVFGDAGRHARSAIGTNALPFNISVEIELLLEVM